MLDGRKRSRTVSAEAKYDGQSREEAKLIPVLCGFYFNIQINAIASRYEFTERAESL